MRTDHGAPREDPLVDMGYETRDLNLKNIRNTTIGFFIFAFASFAVVGLWFYLANPHLGFTRRPNAVTPQYPYPLLQSNITTRTDIMTLRQHESLILTTTARNNDGSVRIPIDRAMNLIVQRGLPATSAEVPAPQPGNAVRSSQQPIVAGAAAPTTGTPDPGTQVPTADPNTPGANDGLGSQGVRQNGR